MKLHKFATLFLALVMIMTACTPAATPTPAAQPAAATSVPAAATSAPAAAGAKWCSGVHLRFFAGGDAGDAFASIVLRGAKAAEADLGPTVDYVFSGWDTSKLISQLGEAIAAQPDGIAYMGTRRPVES